MPTNRDQYNTGGMFLPFQSETKYQVVGSVATPGLALARRDDVDDRQDGKVDGSVDGCHAPVTGQECLGAIGPDEDAYEREPVETARHVSALSVGDEVSRGWLSCDAWTCAGAT